MKVFHLIESLVPGGAEMGLVSMASPLAARGVESQFAYLRRRPGLQDQLEREGFEVVCLAGRQGRLGWVRRFAGLVNQERPDLVHTTLYEANLVGRVAGTLTGTPVVTSLVNVPYGLEQRSAPGLQGWKVRATQLLDLATSRRVVRFHAITETVADVMALRLRLPRSRIDVVPRGRDPAVLGQRTAARRAQARDELQIRPSSGLVLAAARQEHQKGLDILLEAMPIVRLQRPEAHLVVAGRPGNQTTTLQAAVTRLGLEGSVQFLGVRHDVPDLLCAADVFVLPSRWEGLGSVLLEAMALRAPIVASDLAPVREVLSDQREGLLVPPNRPKALAAAIVATLGDQDGARERAERAFVRFADCFTIDRVATEMKAFYERALAGAGKP